MIRRGKKRQITAWKDKNNFSSLFPSLFPTISFDDGYFFLSQFVPLLVLELYLDE